ncbi:FecR family protein [Chondromyces crocatus]|uniref:FecR protein domain-containing protein n=1 Tax=Chondromyces crocatus TaxID=52 RepID=A0A0K1ERA7_CHOCO|nr:FecR family protein [Chondromyces crocatus]AKT43138.1 uncharacterized protein CMC5_073660 [Chondromyces crocatus]
MTGGRRFERAREHLEDELRSAPVPEPDWDRMERALLARVNGERQGEDGSLMEHMPGKPHGLRRASRVLALVAVAAAAALGIQVATRRASPPVTEAAFDEPALAHVETGDGSPEDLDLSTLAPGTRVEALDAPLGLRHAGVVRWTLGRGGIAHVREAAGDPVRYVVALERGALRADVTPRGPASPPQEVFAVEVERARVTVRGTIFEVVRADDRIEVSVTRGVVDVGATSPGESAPVQLIAPSRGTFSFEGSPLRMHASASASHDPSFSEGARFAAPASSGSALSTSSAASSTSASASHRAGAASTALASVGERPSGPARSHAVPGGTEPLAQASAATGDAAPTPERVTLSRQQVQATLAACFASRTSAASASMQTSIRSTLRIALRLDGSVSGVRFDPPLKPELQTCAHFLFAARLAEREGEMAIPIVIEH